MSPADWLSLENCHILKLNNKIDVLNFLIRSLKTSGKITDGESLSREIFYREDLLSTGMEEGIAIPHAKCHEISRPVGAVGVQPRGIPDYQSSDGKIIRLVFMILVGKKGYNQHLEILKSLMDRLKEPGDREKLIRSKTPRDIYQFFCPQEGEKATLPQRH